MTKRKRKPDDVTNDIAELRAQIGPKKQELQDLYEALNDLYEEGHLAGVPITHMARAGGAALAVGNQSVRDALGRRGYGPDGKNGEVYRSGEKKSRGKTPAHAL